MQTRYAYRAVEPEGRIRKGSLLADSPDQVLDYLSGEQLTPIRVEPAPVRPSLILPAFLRPAYHERLIAFTSSLTALYRAGVPILRALSLIKIGPAGGRFDRAVAEIRLAVKSGRSLSSALEDHADLFPRVYTAGVKAGEESGKLDEILIELRAMLEHDLELTRAVKSGVRYPITVVSAILAAAGVLLLYVVPRFSDFYNRFDSELPLPTRLLIGLQGTVAAFWPLLLAALVLGGILLARFASRESGRLWLDRRFVRLPIIGDLIVKGSVARFAMMFHILFRAGIPVTDSLDILAATVKNRAVAGDIRRMAALFREGRDSRLADHEFAHFPPLALQMMAVGLESGSLAEILREISEYYAKEVRYTARQLTALLEPVLTLALGVFVLFLALAIFLPMWNLIKVFNG